MFRVTVVVTDNEGCSTAMIATGQRQGGDR
jgi:hypothetical protein